MTSRYLIGNAQMIGRKEVQSNYFATAYNHFGHLLAVLADGNVDHLNGRKAAKFAVESCIYEFSQDRLQLADKDDTLETVFGINKRVQELLYMKPTPRLSLTIAIFAQHELRFFTVGSNRLFLYNGHNERLIDYDEKSPFFFGKYGLGHKNVVGIYSVGAHTVTHPMERIKIVECSNDSISDKAQSIVDTVVAKGLQSQLNATALLVEVRK